MDFTRELAMISLGVIYFLISWRICFPVVREQPKDYYKRIKLYPMGTPVRVSFPELGRYYEQAIVISTHYLCGDDDVWHRVLLLGDNGFTFSVTIYDSKNITCWNETHVWEDWYEKNKETREWIKACREQYRGQNEMLLHGL